MFPSHLVLFVVQVPSGVGFKQKDLIRGNQKKKHHNAKTLCNSPPFLLFSFLSACNGFMTLYLMYFTTCVWVRARELQECVISWLYETIEDACLLRPKRCWLTAQLFVVKAAFDLHKIKNACRCPVVHSHTHMCILHMCLWILAFMHLPLTCMTSVFLSLSPQLEGNFYNLIITV